MTSLAALPETRIEDLPIPADVRPNSRWTPSMLEMAAHIGPYETLKIVERYGGLSLYIPQVPPSDWHVLDIIGWQAAAKLCSIYTSERLPIPVAAAAVRHAKRASVVAAIRAKEMSLTEGAHILRTSRTYLSGLVNGSDEGETALPAVLPRKRHPGQIELFDEDQAA